MENKDVRDEKQTKDIPSTLESKKDNSLKETSNIIVVDVNDENAEKIMDQPVAVKKLGMRRWAFILAIIGAGLILVTSTSYAILNFAINGKKTFSMKVGTLDFEIQNETNAIGLKNAYPMTDSEGQALTPYTFTIKNTGTLDGSYNISLVDTGTENTNCPDCELLGHDKIKVELKRNGVTIIEPTFLSEITNLDSHVISAKSSIDYELRLWLDYDRTTVDDIGKVYSSKINVTLTQDLEGKNTVSGNYINISNGQDKEIRNIKIEGNTNNGVNLGNDGILDVVVTGKNLIKKQGYSTSKDDSEFWANIDGENFGSDRSNVKTDGWINITMTSSDTSGQSSNLFLKTNAFSRILPSSKYTYYYEYVNHGDSSTLNLSNSDNNSKSYFMITSPLLNIEGDGYRGTQILSTQDSLENSDYGIRTYATTKSNNSTVDFDIRTMILYGDVKLENVGEYEAYKERRYSIPLIDNNGATINGLATGDILQRINDVYVISKSDGTTVNLSSQTQNALNSIKTYAGVSNIFIDGDILPSNMEITYIY